jgi:GDP/UDP-N,N'-diacetylbacillosamine 2-epimerase (hydrolysing)
MRYRMRNIAVITGSRAEYGLLRKLIFQLRSSSDIQLTIFATGQHLSDISEPTIKEIYADNLLDIEKVPLSQRGDSPDDICMAFSNGVSRFSAVFRKSPPDLLLVVGDRFETFAAVVAASFHGIAIAHIHGGELTLGALDDSIRHAITKFAHLHFVASPIYRDRVIQLGETPATVFDVGGLGVDAIKSTATISKDELEHQLGLRFKNTSILVTFHPVTRERGRNRIYILELLTALASFENSTIIFTLPNEDLDSEVIRLEINNFSRHRRNCHIFSSLGQLLYFSTIAAVDVVVGNSSSGLLEVPAFGKPTINIGTRQLGRITASTVFNCPPESSEIRKLVELALAGQLFDVNKPVIESHFGTGGASSKIVEILRLQDLKGIGKKGFFDCFINNQCRR